MKIGELAARSGLNASAIRYYEKRALLPAPHRAGCQRARHLKSLLEHLLHCRCISLEVCVERLGLSPKLRLISRGAKSLSN